MTTITITKENFGQKMSILYKKMNTFGEVKIKLENGNDWDEFTIKNKKAWLKSKKELDNGDTLPLEYLKAKYM